MQKTDESLRQAVQKLRNTSAQLALYLAERLDKNALSDTPQLRTEAANALQAAEELRSLLEAIPPTACRASRR